MNTPRKTALAVAVSLALGACADSPVGPDASARSASADRPELARQVDGTGLIIDNLTGVTVPLIGEVGNVIIDQAIITELGVVEDLAGNIIGVRAEGVPQLSGGVLGTDIVTQDFTGGVQVLSSGRGQCDLVNIELAPVAVDALGTAVFVDVPQASVTPRLSGALGPLLCNLGSLLNAPIGHLTT